MNNGACEDFIDALLSKFTATDDLRTLQKNSNDFEKLSDEPLTVDVLKKCFAEDRCYWEWTLEELSDSLQPLDSRARMFSSALMRKRAYYRRLLLSRLEVLRGILKQKELRNLPITEREASCVARLERLRDSEDPVLSRATDRFQQIMKAVQQEDDSLLRSIDLYPVKPTKSHQRDSVPQLEDLLEEHKRRLQELGSAPRPPHLNTKDVRLAAIINAVEAEQRQADKRKKKEPTASAAGGAKADRLRNLSTQRKPARRRQHQQAAGAPRGKHAPTRDITRFPPSFYQYIRGFFNLLRLLLLEMASPEEESLNTEQICALVNAWQSTPRAQRTNSPWINRCSDWSLVAAPALKLLSTSGRGSPLARLVSSAHTDQQIRLPPRGFVAFNEKYDTWYWLGGSGGISQPADVEIETALLARLFSIWAKADSGAGGLKDVWMEAGHSFEEYSLRSSPPPAKRSRAPPRALPNGGGDRRHHSTVNAGDDSEDEYFYGEDEQEDEEVDDLQIVSSSSVARGRQKNPSKPQRVTENVPPPYFPTEWECRLSTPEQRRSFQTQEIQRFSQPWSPFVYNQHGYASVVGPVRTASVNFAGRGSGRAREHPLLRSDRPAWVSISEIVRDAVARLPNGEGTRPEIAMLVQDSAFLAPNFNPRQLSQCISSALDRLQGEGTQSPVMYDCSRRLWIYRYRHLSPEDFFKMYEDEMASRADRFNEVMYTASSAYGGGRGGRPSGADRSWGGGGGRPGLSRAPVSFENRVPDYIPDIDELTVDDPFYYHHQDMDVQYGRQRQQQQHSRPGDDSYYEGEALEESDEEDSRDMDGGFAFSRQQSCGPPPRDHVSTAAAAAEGVEGIANASDRFFSEPRRMMLHYRPR
nr:unnamed protein product [Spirometra erinaceieuropaei]